MPLETPSLSISVSELNRRARQTLERAIPLLWVTGEISNLTRAASGHVYFTLKDETAQVRCVMFRSRANLVPWQLANGQQVEVQALVSIYEARGDFQLGVEAMRRSGLGKLYEAFARLREKLDTEGLLAAERKRKLPHFPRAIGIVTSLQAAALRDIVAACSRRAPHLPLIVFPTPVQGEGSADQISRAIALASASGLCDVMIVARGGGSIEDLWSFNEESVARAIAASAIPVVSGVGHETDITIADFVADSRAATPTAAAELTTSGWFNAASEVDRLRDGMQRQMRRAIETRMQRVDTLGRRLLHPRQRLEKITLSVARLRAQLDSAMRDMLNQRAGNLANARLQVQRQRPNLPLAQSMLTAKSVQLARTAHGSLTQHRHHLEGLADAIRLLDPRGTLARGYSIARDVNGNVVRSSTQVSVGSELHIDLSAGWVNTSVNNTG